MNITIEPTQDATLLTELNEGVQNLHHELYPDVFKLFDFKEIEPVFRKMLSNASVHAFVASIDGQPVGYLLCYLKQQPETAFQYAQTTLNIDQVMVLQAYRKNGVATRLLERAFSLAKEQGIREIELNHWEGNATAGRFFADNGFSYFNHRMKRIING